MALSKVSKDMLEKRRALMEKFDAIRERNEQLYKSSLDTRIKLRESDDNVDEDESEETVEFLIKEETIVIEDDDD